ncbi:Aldo/keto reductase [Peniophora sp. CONT]|nr:Aldo/keto reductase [Peniophora sp. CONT]
MPWEPIKTNDGRSIPSIAFGTWTLGKGQDPIEQVEQGISVGFSHLDTAQLYQNEEEVGQAIRESGLARDELWVTTKFSSTETDQVEVAIRNSLRYLGLDYVDLYLVHWPRIAKPDIPTFWAKMEKIHAEGLAKSIGVSNFDVPSLEILLASAKVKPVANQIRLHPYLYAEQKPTMDLCAKHGIIIEAYSALIPITKQPGGPLDAPMNAIATRLSASPDQVLLAWVKAKGAISVTTSSKRYRLEGYLNAGDITLTAEDVAALDAAGAAQGAWKGRIKAVGWRTMQVCATALAAYKLAEMFIL